MMGRRISAALSPIVVVAALFAVVQVHSASTTLTVNSNGDTADATPGDGLCGQVTGATPATPAGPGGIPPAQPGSPGTVVAGTCTLHAAIQEANANSAFDSIAFNVAPATNNANTVTITLTGALPAITKPLAIDATNGGNAVTVTGNNQFSLLQYTSPASGTDASSGSYSIKNLTLTGGVNPATTGGGGIYFGPKFPASLTLTTVNVTNSSTAATTGPTGSAGGPGGGIAIADGRALFMTGGSVTGNTAQAQGGGIAVTSANSNVPGVSDNNLSNTADDVLTLTNVTVSGNKLNATTNGQGGNLFADLMNGGDINITGSTITGGDATGGGGGNLWVRRVLSSSDLLVSGSTLSGGKAANGAGVLVKQGLLMIQKSTLSGNTATSTGGGVYLDIDGNTGGSALLANDTISGNSASMGGGIGAATTNPAASQAYYNTITLNTATTANMGGGILTATNPNTTFPGAGNSSPFNSNIITANTGGNCKAKFTHSDPNNSGYNLTDDASCGLTQSTDKTVTASAVGLKALGNYPVAPATHALLVTSPALESGNPAWAPSTDERGADTQDGDFNGTVQRDIGAYEFGGFGVIQLLFPGAASTFPVDEDAGTVTVTLHRYGKTSSTAVGSAPTVNIATSDGSAVSGTGGDYVTLSPNPTTVSFAAGILDQSLPITINNDQTAESDETFNLTLSNTTAGADLGAKSTGTVTIRDAENGQFQFNPITYQANEGNSGSNGSAVLTITRTGGSHGAVRVSYSTINDTTCTPQATCTATAGTDYTAVTNGTVDFADGETSKTIAISLTGDGVSEPNENFKVRLATVACQNLTAPQSCDAHFADGTSTASTGTPPANSVATVTIINDDGAATLNVGDVQTTEGDSGTKTLTFTVTLVPASSQTVTVNYATANGTATGGSSCSVANADYVTTTSSTPLSFAPGETTKTIPVTICGDAVFENDETFTVSLNTATNAAIGTAGTGTIQNDDATPAQGAIGFVDCASSGTNCAVQTVVEATPTNSKTFAVKRVGNNSTSTTASVSFAVTNPGYSTFTNNAACTTDAVGPDYRISTTNATSGTTNTVVVVNTDGTGTITYNGNTNGDAALVIQACDDTRRETDQLIGLKLSNPTSGATLGTAAGQLTIQSDEKVRFQLNPTAQTVYKGEDSMVTITAEALDPVDGEPVCITYKTADGSAVSPNDYNGVDNSATPCSGILSWNNGQSGSAGANGTTKFTVMIGNDGTVNSGNKSFTANLLATTNGGTIVSGGNVDTVTIAQHPRVYLCPTGDSSSDCADQLITSSRETGTLRFRVKRDGDTSAVSTVQYQITTGTGTGAASFGPSGDFDSVTGGSNVASGAITFGAGVTSQYVDVKINPDTVVEGDETFTFMLKTGSASNAALSCTTTTPCAANGTITDDDYRFDVSVSPSSVKESDGSVTVTVKRVGAAFDAASVSYATADGTATSPDRYSAINGTFSWAAGDAADKTANVSIVNDNIDEANDAATFTVNLSGASKNATGSGEQESIGTGSATVTIQDDDTAGITLTPSSLTVNESGATSTSYSVALTSQPTAMVTVDIAASVGGQVTVSPATLTFSPTAYGAQTVTVTAIDDRVAEGDQSYALTHTASSADGKYNAGGATFSPANGQVAVTVVDDDTAGVTVTESDGSTQVQEGGSNGADSDSFTVVLNSKPTNTVTVQYSFDGSRLMLNGSTVSPLTLTFSATDGDATSWNVAQTVTVTAVNDSVANGNGTLTLAGATDSDDQNYKGAGMAGAPNARDVSVSVTDNDSVGVTASKSQVTATEGGMTDSYTLVLNSQPAGNVTITATPSTGEVSVSPSTVTFTSSNWNTPQTITVTATDDTVSDGSQTGTISHSVSGSSDYSGTSVASVQFVAMDNDGTPSLSIADASAAEASGGTAGVMRFTVMLSNVSSQAVTASYATADGTAVSGADYQLSRGTVTVPAGSTSAVIEVALVNDSVAEPTETFSISLSNVQNAGLGRAQATGTITDDDVPSGSASATDSQGRTVSFSTDAGGFASVGSTTQPAAAPTNLTYDNGFFAYSISGLTNGGSANVTITLPAGSSANTYVNCPSTCFTTATAGGTVVTVALVDGGPGDADGVANGVITVKAGGAGRAASNGGGGGGNNNGGGKNGGGSFGAGLLFGLAGLGVLRRRSRKPNAAA